MIIDRDSVDGSTKPIDLRLCCFTRFAVDLAPNYSQSSYAERWAQPTSPSHASVRWRIESRYPLNDFRHRQTSFDSTVVYVMHYPYVFQVGGIGSYIRDLSQTLLNAHRMKLIMVYPTLEPTQISEESIGQGLLVHQTYQRLSPRCLGSLDPRSFWRPFRKLCDILVAETVTAVHLHSLFAPALLSAALACRTISDFPLIVTSHSEAKRRTTGIRERSRFFIAEHFLNQEGVHLVGVSHASIIGFAKVPTFIASGVDVNYFAPTLGSPERFRRWLTDIRGKPVTEKTKIALYPARVLPAKGQRDLLVLAKAMKNAHMDALVVAMGGFSDLEYGNYAKDLHRAIASNGLGEYYIFVDQAQARERVRDGLAASTVMPFPSSTEAMPLSVLEANAMRIPVVAYAAGGLREVIQPGETGVLVPTGEADTLASAVLDLFRDESTRIRMGITARDRITAGYSLQSLAEQHYRLYETLSEPLSRANPDIPTHLSA